MPNKIVMPMDAKKNHSTMLGIVKRCMGTKFTSQIRDMIVDLAIGATTSVEVDLGQGLQEVDNKKYIKVKQVFSIVTCLLSSKFNSIEKAQKLFSKNCLSL